MVSQVGFVTFFLSSILDNLSSTIVMVSLLRKLVPQSEYRKYEKLSSFMLLLVSFLVKLFTVRNVLGL